jgi:hypothetical protein
VAVAVAQVTVSIHHNQLVQLVAGDHVTLTQAQAVAEEQAEQVDMHSVHIIIITGTFVQDIQHTHQLEMKVHQLVDKVNVQIAHQIKAAAVVTEDQVYTVLAVAVAVADITVQETVQMVEETAETQLTMAVLEAMEHKDLTELVAVAAEQIMVEHLDVVVMEHA